MCVSLIGNFNYCKMHPWNYGNYEYKRWSSDVTLLSILPVPIIPRVHFAMINASYCTDSYSCTGWKFQIRHQLQMSTLVIHNRWSERWGVPTPVSFTFSKLFLLEMIDKFLRKVMYYCKVILICNADARKLHLIVCNSDLFLHRGFIV